MMRFLRAVLEALRLTIRAETFVPRHYQPLADWIAEGLRLLDRVRECAASGGVALEEIALKLDGRPTSLERSLQMARHNLVNEYPRLMRMDDPFSMAVVQASNFNDHYRISQFLATELGLSEEVNAALAALEAHLLSLPQIERPEPGT